MPDDRTLPACCYPSEGASVAEQLYCAYQRGGPPERAGLAWNGEPCPTWAMLVERVQSGDEGAAGVISKWEAVARAQMEQASPARPLMSPEDAQKWEDFRSRDGLLWWVNRSLHLFGYALVVRYDEEGRLFAVAPERASYRGFSLESEDRGFMRVTQMMQREAALLVADVEADDE